MRHAFLAVVALPLALCACQTTGSSGGGSTASAPSASTFNSVPLPANTDIAAPGPDVPANLAAFSGKWGGIWDGVLPSLVVIESVSATGDVRGVYAWGAYGTTTPGSTRFRTKINGNAFTWGGGTKFDFVMKDGKLHGERTVSGSLNTVVMSKVQ